MDIVTKKKLNILIQLAEADKHFAKAEREMIFQIARERNFHEEEVANLIRNPEPIEGLGALSQPQKIDYLISSIQLIFADQKVFESEIIFVKNIAIKLGFKKTVVDYLLENFEKTGVTHLGLIAEDVEVVIPNVVVKQNEQGYQMETGGKPSAITYHELIPVLIKAVQEQQQQIETLKQQNDLLIKRLEALEKK